MTSTFTDRFIEVALAEGYLEPEDVRWAMAELRKAKDEGKPVRLHRVLLEGHRLNEEQLLEIRREMARRGVRRMFGEFEVISRLGRGATGTVYCCRQPNLDRLVALKIMAGHLAADEALTERFLHEARLAARLNHPNIIQVFDVGRHRHTHFIVMEYVPGRSLEKMIRLGERLTEYGALRVAEGIAGALDYASRRGIIHRDIKPGNIILTSGGVVKLADLGIALGPGEHAQESAGTPFYISPEQARSDPRLDVRSDLYALGCTLYHALTGQPPYAGNCAVETIRMHAEAPIPDARQARPDLSAGLAGLLTRMMAKRPQDRFKDAAELAEASRSVRHGGRS